MTHYSQERLSSHLHLHAFPPRFLYLGCSSGSLTLDLSAVSRRPPHTGTDLETQRSLLIWLKNRAEANRVESIFSVLLSVFCSASKQFFSTHLPPSTPLTQFPWATLLDACIVTDICSRRVTARSSRSINPSMVTNLEAKTGMASLRIHSHLESVRSHAVVCDFFFFYFKHSLGPEQQTQTNSHFTFLTSLSWFS